MTRSVQSVTSMVKLDHKGNIQTFLSLNWHLVTKINYFCDLSFKIYIFHMSEGHWSTFSKHTTLITLWLLWRYPISVINALSWISKYRDTIFLSHNIAMQCSDLWTVLKMWRGMLDFPPRCRYSLSIFLSLNACPAWATPGPEEYQ